MRTLQEYRVLAAKLAVGEVNDDRIRAFVQELCSGPWETDEDRNAAQVLVWRLELRLERARHEKLGQVDVSNHSNA